MSLRPFRLPADLALLAELLPAAFHYPENPDWSWQTDEAESTLRLVNTARRLWPLFSLLMKFSPAARDALHGFVWEQDGQPVGMVNISREGVTDDWVITNVAVLPQYRRRGIARALVEAALGLARQHHAKRVLLDVIAGNTPAYDLYASMGFEHFSTSVTLRHAAPTPVSTAAGAVPAGYATTALSSQAWRPYFALAQRITPPEVQRYRPVTEQQFRQAASVRIILLLLNTFAGVREHGLVVSTATDQRNVAALRLSAHTRGAEMNTCTLWLDPAHQELVPYLVRSALGLSQKWSPRSRLELTVPTWEPALIEAASASEFAPAHETQAMGMKLYA
jgi:ribosomal protein S18 acetylase RimI-like enzyme